MDEPRIPQYYVVSRSLTEEQTARVQQALALTPVSFTIITDIHDAKLAMQFTPMVMKTDTFERAQKMAGESREPVVILSNVLFVDAYYEDGEHDSLSA